MFSHVYCYRGLDSLAKLHEGSLTYMNISMAKRAKVINYIFFSFELKMLLNISFYALSNGVNKIFMHEIIFEIHSVQRDIFLL